MPFTMKVDRVLGLVVPRKGLTVWPTSLTHSPPPHDY